MAGWDSTGNFILKTLAKKKRGCLQRRDLWRQPSLAEFGIISTARPQGGWRHPYFHQGTAHTGEGGAAMEKATLTISIGKTVKITVTVFFIKKTTA